MDNFWKGLILFVTGLAIWTASSFIEGMIGFEVTEELEMVTRHTALYPIVIISFAVMIISPIIFWIILPIRNMIRKKHNYFIERRKKKSK